MSKTRRAIQLDDLDQGMVLRIEYQMPGHNRQTATGKYGGLIRTANLLTGKPFWYIELNLDEGVSEAIPTTWVRKLRILA